MAWESEAIIEKAPRITSYNVCYTKLLRSIFTATGKRKVPGPGGSYGTARELMRYLLRMEQGRLVDVWSSREIKRMLYVTERRIRYASSPALAGAAVYFKSGSLYQCKPEPGYIV